MTDPAQQLPVASCPAVLALGTDVIAGGELLDDLDIGCQARPCENSLEQVMAQVAVLWHTRLQSGTEGIDVVDAFPGERTFAKQVLIDVRGGGGVRVHATGP
ncbi:hypothetical protein D3C78_670980 [compost metagenome]